MSRERHNILREGLINILRGRLIQSQERDIKSRDKGTMSKL